MGYRYGLRVLVAGVAAAGLLGVAACGGTGTAKTAAPGVTVSVGSTAVAVAGGAPTVSPSPAAPSLTATLPSTAVLRSALLTATDLGPAFSKMPSDNSGSGNSPVGCPKVDGLMGGSDPTRNEVDAQFEGNKAGPFVGESLAAGTPAALSVYFGQVKAAMSSCRSLTFGSGSDAMTMTASPISFGGPDTVALRLDGTTSGVQVTGYLTVDNLHSAIMGYFYLELFSGGSQMAFAFHTQALAKAQRVLGGVGGQ